MRPYLADLLNRAFGTTVFTYLLPNYLMMLAAGAFVGTVYSARRARARGLNPEIYYGLILWALPAALLGGRVMGFLYAPETYGHSLLNLFDPLRGDSAAYGGFIGGTAAGIGYMLYRRVQVWPYLDCAGPPLGVAAAFTRVGCFLDGCDFGSITACPFAVTFPAGSDAHQAHVQAGLVPESALASLPVHPVQLYLVLGDLALAAVVAWRSRRPGRVAGESFLEFWVLYAVMRSGLESFRGDAVRGFLGPLSTSQAVSAGVLCVAGALIIARRDRRHLTIIEAMAATGLAVLVVKLGAGKGGWLEALTPAVWVYLPIATLLARRLPLEAHGFSLKAWSGGARWLAAFVAGVLLPFAFLVAASRWMAGRTAGWEPERLLEWAPVWQLVLVAVPEEIFFRGYLQQRIRVWALERSPDRPLRAAWMAIAASALLFAGAHVAVEPGWVRAAVLFPGLLMGWLRERTGGLLAPTGFHWLANITVLGLGWVE